MLLSKSTQKSLWSFTLNIFFYFQQKRTANLLSHSKSWLTSCPWKRLFQYLWTCALQETYLDLLLPISKTELWIFLWEPQAWRISTLNKECLPAPETKKELTEAAPVLQAEDQLLLPPKWKREMKPNPPTANFSLPLFSLSSTRLYCLNLGMWFICEISSGWQRWGAKLHKAPQSCWPR